MKYYQEALKKYAVFSGRATRSEYWYFVLFNTIFSIVISILGGIIHDSYGILSSIYGLALFIPAIAVFARRMHDIGKSGWWWLIMLIPLVGTIWLIVLLATDSNPGDNKYGPDPKGIVVS